MRILSWNIAGIRTKLRNKCLNFLLNEEYEIVCFQETKGSESQIEKEITHALKEVFPYRYYKHCDGSGLQRKGLNGVAIWSKYKAKKRPESMSFAEEEGRVLALDFGTFNLVTVYTPNGQEYDTERFKFRINEWDNNFRQWINSFSNKTIICGDFNVAHTNLDLHKRWSNLLDSNIIVGATDEERNNFNCLIEDGWIDIFRKLNPHAIAFTYWDQRIPVYRKRNLGWRIDYFLIKTETEGFIHKTKVLPHIFGSDHCPVSLSISLSVPKKKLVIVE